LKIFHNPNFGLGKRKFLSVGAIVSGIVCCLTGFIDAPVALVSGVLLSQILGNPLSNYTRVFAHTLLQLSVVGLGFGMNLFEVSQISKEAFGLTVCSIAFTLILGFVVGKFLAVNQKTTWLIASGTAICGGSAIAAIAPIIDARENETSSALTIVFLLNSIALILFPYIGNELGLSQNQFGMWAAVAIHDTSSVVGAAQKYGDAALQIATTVKLGRALWIIPLSVLITFLNSKKSRDLSFPFFIFFFVAAASMHTFIPQFSSVSVIIVLIAKRGLTLALFFIGLGMVKTDSKVLNLKPLLLGIILWVMISLGSLCAII
jgi:uncharacterized integral membrane protein (TIGR00698 family)